MGKVQIGIVGRGVGELGDGKVAMGKERGKKKGCCALCDAGLAGPVVPLH